MRAIAAILRSYLRPHFLVIMLFAVILFLVAIGLADWSLSLYSVGVVAGIVGFHLTRMVESSASDLLPRYHSRQLAVAGLVVALISLGPVLLAHAMGVSWLPSVAAFLFFICWALWATFLYDNYGMMILGSVAFIWIFADLHLDHSRLAWLGAFIGPLWSVWLAVGSTCGLLFFGFHYRGVSSIHFRGRLKANYLSMKPEGWIDSSALGIAERSISRLAKRETGRQLSNYKLVRLFQYGLFSPQTIVTYYGILLIVLFCFVATYIAFVMTSDIGTPMNSSLPWVLYIVTLTQTGDFLSSRNRMQAVYLPSPLPSRNSFLAFTILSLFLTFGRSTLSTILTFIVIHLVFPWTTWTYFPQLCIIGITLSFISTSITLFACDRMRRPLFGVGYLIFLLLIIMTMQFFVIWFCPHFWAFLAASLPLSLITFWLAMRKWKTIEMEFVG